MESAQRDLLSIFFFLSPQIQGYVKVTMLRDYTAHVTTELQLMLFFCNTKEAEG